MHACIAVELLIKRMRSSFAPRQRAVAAAAAAAAMQKTLTARLHSLPMPIAIIHASLAVTHSNGSALASS